MGVALAGSLDHMHTHVHTHTHTHTHALTHTHVHAHTHTVNDLGGDMHGGGRSPAADAVVATIKKNGGTAVANYGMIVQ